MKRILSLVIIMCLVGYGYAFAYRSNASPFIVSFDENTNVVSKTFTPSTRDLMIYNNDSSNYVWVNLNTDTATAYTSACYLLGPESSLELYDFITEGITIIADSSHSAGPYASPPVSGIALY